MFIAVLGNVFYDCRSVFAVWIPDIFASVAVENYLGRKVVIYCEGQGES